jgi:membrane fusion protein, multidrug efflux system
MPSATEGAENAKTNDAGDAKDSGKDTQEGGKEAQPAGPAKPRSKKPLIILGAVVVVAAIIAFIIWFAYRNQVSTDDAYTDGNVITMAPKVSGYVVELLIDDNSRVRKGELLLRIEPQDFQTAQAAAQSRRHSLKPQKPPCALHACNTPLN